MKIRSITSFFNPNQRNSQDVLRMLGELTQQMKNDMSSAGYQVQSSRLATISFAKYLKSNKPDEAISFVKEWVRLAEQAGFNYLSLGTLFPDSIKYYTLIPGLLQADSRVFVSGSMVSRDGKISMQTVQACAEVIHSAAIFEANGFANLRFAALASVAPYAPFFPAAYSDSNSPALSLAIEGADMAINTIQTVKNIADVQKKLGEILNDHAKRLEALVKPLCRKFSVDYKGLDFSYAPYPKDESSIGAAMEAFGISKLGGAGSVATAAILTAILDKGKWKKVGFNGLMLPILEDSILARRVADGDLTLKDLLLFSCVCGTGLDTIPLAGDARVDQIKSLLLDVAVLSTRLNKPLTARLMPIPGKAAGDLTEFNFEYFANSRVMELHAEGVKGCLADSIDLNIPPR